MSSHDRVGPLSCPGPPTSMSLPSHSLAAEIIHTPLVRMLADRLRKIAAVLQIAIVKFFSLVHYSLSIKGEIHCAAALSLNV